MGGWVGGGGGVVVCVCVCVCVCVFVCVCLCVVVSLYSQCRLLRLRVQAHQKKLLTKPMFVEASVSAPALPSAEQPMLKVVVVCWCLCVCVSFLFVVCFAKCITFSPRYALSNDAHGTTLPQLPYAPTYNTPTRTHAHTQQHTQKNPHTRAHKHACTSHQAAKLLGMSVSEAEALSPSASPSAGGTVGSRSHSQVYGIF